MSRAEILDKAKSIICTDRNNQYGEPEDTFELIAKLWSLYLGYPIAPSDVGVLMALLKIGRMANGVKLNPDNYIDAIGYIACALELEERNVQ